MANWMLQHDTASHDCQKLQPPPQPRKPSQQPAHLPPALAHPPSSPGPISPSLTKAEDSWKSSGSLPPEQRLNSDTARQAAASGSPSVKEATSPSGESFGLRNGRPRSPCLDVERSGGGGGGGGGSGSARGPAPGRVGAGPAGWAYGEGRVVEGGSLGPGHVRDGGLGGGAAPRAGAPIRHGYGH
jgi:hypothetical protein